MPAVNLKSKTARGKLAPRKEPYWERLASGLFVGYKKFADVGGGWSARRANDAKRYDYHPIGDDSTLDYDEAVTAAHAWNQELSAGVKNSDLTVADICKLYVSNRLKEKGSKCANDARNRFVRYVYPETCVIERGAKMPNGKRKRIDAFVYRNPIGLIPFAKLKPLDVERWRDAQLDNDDPDDIEAYKRAKDSINRNLSTLKAACNYAKDILNLVSTDKGWKSIKYYKGVDARREGYLNAEQRGVLLGAMQADLRVLATALLLIGARPGEIANANISDFDKKRGRLFLDGKTGPRTISLSDQANEFFATQSKDRIGNAPLLVMANGERWKARVWGELFREARERAKMPDAVLYYMRHTYITEAIAQGLNIYTVAEQTGTSVRIIESNYGNQTDDIVERLNRIAII
ncbi:tyrosine-type recombinase/integrase [Paraburkholderia tropica]|uniref:tyrosine-type recombinase/integrase n=1 Tax=Paraburkholderia tropica TaxID=92647 RepID=UPI002AB1B81C|nr:tyrosine-type recombinase/integrase [Paraburkholderia tropica]